MKTLKISLMSLTMAAALAGCGAAAPNGQPSATLASTTHRSLGTAPVRWPVVRLTRVGHLPEAVMGNSLALSSDGLLYSSGGYTGVYSLDHAYRLLPNFERIGLPERTHDAATGFLGGALYIFGGGQANSISEIVRIHHSVAAFSGRLTSPLSDAVSVPFRHNGQDGLLLLGGYDGQTYNLKARFVSLAGGKLQFTILFSLPAGLRYAGVATAGGNVFIAAGSMPSGLSNKVYQWSARTHVVKVVATLPHGLEKAAAFVSGRFLIVAGGKASAGQPRSDIWAIDTVSGKSRIVAHLPQPLADMGYAQYGTRAYLAGGVHTASDSAVSDIYQITLQ